jgi:hypothetical protein
MKPNEDYYRAYDQPGSHIEESGEY